MKIAERIKSSKWWRAAGIRAVKTFAEAAIAAIGTAAVMWEVDWRYTLSAACLAAIISILVSLAGLPEVPEEEPAGEEPEGTAEAAEEPEETEEEPAEEEAETAEETDPDEDEPCG